jgi:hypothetical protein
LGEKLAKAFDQADQHCRLILAVLTKLPKSLLDRVGKGRPRCQKPNNAVVIGPHGLGGAPRCIILRSDTVRRSTTAMAENGSLVLGERSLNASSTSLADRGLKILN